MSTAVDPIDEMIGGLGDRLPDEKRKYRICATYDCQRLLPGDCPWYRKYCTETCGRRHRAMRRLRTPVTRQCRWCRKTFIPKPNQVYCTVQCKTKSSRKRGREWRKRNLEFARRSAREYQRLQRRLNRIEYPPKPCGECGKPFTPNKSTDKYCSVNTRDSCQQVAHRRLERERYARDPNHRRDRIAQNLAWKRENRAPNRDSSPSVVSIR